MSKKPVVREETADDVPDVRRVVGAAFGGARVPELLDGLRESVAWLGLSYVVEKDDAVVAHVAFTRGWVDMREKLLEVLILSPLSVLPDRQRTGLGSMLVRESLRLLESRDEPLVFLEGDPGYYSRLGFVSGDRLHFTPPSVRIPEPAFQVATLTGYESTMAGALVYPDVFWRHDSVGLRPER